MAAGWATSPTTPTATWRRNTQPTTGISWGNDDITTTSSAYYSNTYSGNVAVLEFRDQNDTERLFEKGKFFKFESSMEFRAWFKRPNTVPRAVKSRHGFQQMCRLPCYRGVRTR